MSHGSRHIPLRRSCSTTLIIPPRQSFLELYEWILSSVNFHLYTESNLHYFRKCIRKDDADGLLLHPLIAQRTDLSVDSCNVGIILDGDQMLNQPPLPHDVVQAAQIISTDFVGKCLC